MQDICCTIPALGIILLNTLLLFTKKNIQKIHKKNIRYYKNSKIKLTFQLWIKELVENLILVNKVSMLQAFQNKPRTNQIQNIRQTGCIAGAQLNRTGLNWL